MKRVRRKEGAAAVPAACAQRPDAAEESSECDQAPPAAEAARAEQRRLKNREAARRVRERKNNQLHSYKAQVDELKRENQKLLQIIQQLQSATLCSGSLVASPAALGGAAAGSDAPGAACLSAPCLSGGGGGGGAPDSIESNAQAAAAFAAAGSDKPRPLLVPVGSWPASGGNAAAVAAADAVGNSSSTLQLLAGVHSAPVPPCAPLRASGGSASSQQPAAVALRRSCGCVADQECEECEGVRVTLESTSSLPLVTTPGPRPKPLTLDDLNLSLPALTRGQHSISRGVSCASQHERASCPTLVLQHSYDSAGASAAAAAAAAAGLLSPLPPPLQSPLPPSREQQQQQQRQQQLASAMQVDMDLVETLEPPSRPRSLRPESDSSPGNAVFPPSPAGAELLAASAGCYVRSGSGSQHCSLCAPGQDPGAAAAGAHAHTHAHVHAQLQERGKLKLVRCASGEDTADAAAACQQQQLLLQGLAGVPGVPLDAAAAAGSGAPMPPLAACLDGEQTSTAALSARMQAATPAAAPGKAKHANKLLRGLAAAMGLVRQGSRGGGAAVATAMPRGSRGTASAPFAAGTVGARAASAEPAGAAALLHAPLPAELPPPAALGLGQADAGAAGGGSGSGRLAALRSRQQQQTEADDLIIMAAQQLLQRQHSQRMSAAAAAAAAGASAGAPASALNGGCVPVHLAGCFSGTDCAALHASAAIDAGPEGLLVPGLAPPAWLTTAGVAGPQGELEGEDVVMQLAMQEGVLLQLSER